MISLRRWTMVLLSVWMCAGMLISSAGAAPGEINASYNENSGHVTVSGMLSSSKDALISVHIINPLNQLDLLDQTTTGTDGAYQFNYVPKRIVNGIYFVNVSVEHSDQVIGTTFRIGDDSSSDTPYVNPVAPGIAPAPRVTVDASTGVVTASLDDNEVEQGLAAGNGHLAVEFQHVDGAKQYHLLVPVSMFASGFQYELTIITEFGSITVPSHMFRHESLESAKVVGFVIGKGETANLPVEIGQSIGHKPVITLSATIDGKAVSFHNRNAVVQAAIPYEPTEEERKNPEHLVVWYIDETGKAESVPSGKYDPGTGTVSFGTSHFSSFAVAYVTKSFADLDAVAWAKQPIEVMASKGIIAGISDNAFQPGAKVTRGDFMMLLTKTFGFDAEVTGSFSDVQPADYYYEAVGIAKQLGLAEGQAEGVFNPRDEITRQDMMVLLARALHKAGIETAKGAAGDLDAFDDKSQVAAYAVEAVASLMKGGIVEGSGSVLNPTGNATRAEAAVVLYRIYSKLLVAGTVPSEPGIQLAQ